MVSFAYFDVGGVVDLDFSGTNKWESLKNEIGLAPKFNEEFEKCFDEWEDRMCSGKMDLNETIPLMKEKFNIKFPEYYDFLKNGFIDRFDQNQSIWPVIEKIHKKYKVGLLTNMYPRMFDLIVKNNILPKVKWDVIVDSSVVGARKPEPRIYEIAEQMSNAKGNEIFFIENSASHVDAAKKLGWECFLYDSTKPEESSAKLLNIFETKYL